jgi:hypothetical protein
MKYLLVLILFLAGCATPFTDIEPLIPISQRNKKYHHTIDGVLSHYFTDEAYEAVKDIPAVDGVTFGGSYVPGVNVWASSLSIISGSGFGRKVVFSLAGLRNNGILNVIHEYFHHIDDMTRDGELNLVSPKEFEVAWHRFEVDFPNHAAYVKRFADDAVTDTFGIGEWSEHMAYTLQHLVKYNGPNYMKWVYRKVMKAWTQ